MSAQKYEEMRKIYRGRSVKENTTSGALPYFLEAMDSQD